MTAETINVILSILAAAGIFFMGVSYGSNKTAKLFDDKIKMFLIGLDGQLALVLKQIINSINSLKESVSYEDIGDLERSVATKPPSPEIMEKMSVISRLSQEISEMAMSLEGPLKGSLDAKHRRFVVGQLKEKQEEVQTLMKQCIDSGFNPKVIMIDQNGDKQVKHLSEIVEHITNGPEPLNPFTDDDIPNLGIVNEEDEDEEPVKH